jgi:hypothetical protein
MYKVKRRAIILDLKVIFYFCTGNTFQGLEKDGYVGMCLYSRMSCRRIP